MDIRIADSADLDRTEALVSWLRRPHVDGVAVTVPGLDAARRERSARQLRRHFNDCGCAWSALALVAAVTAALVLGPRGGAIAVAALGCLGAAVTGKLLGLAWSRRRLLTLLRALRTTS
ncbi:hypothetical protein NCC78_19050 [Micromonospora phytophila]|uniref:hypothetical protein n=1 Tax=Micromonospora phytophila TaxID=709888 RepID=UPI00203008C4|nr:hypothetical protein [Micromonospora phytophila]MCM0676766.1 hypothetical protein [Micromonospora phytophila]